MYQYSFERLDVWQDARTLTMEVYEMSEKFPRSETYALRDQIRRAAISIGSNIAEGSGRISHKDQAHYYHLAYSSTMEVLHQAITAHDMDYITTIDLSKIRMHINKVSNKLNALRNYQKNQ